MINEERVKNMTRIAIYEKNQGKSEIAMSRYYKIDYVSYYMLQSFVYATIAFIMIGAALIMMEMQTLLEQVNSLDYIAIAKDVLLLYGVWIFVFMMMSFIIYNVRYDKMKPNIKKYYERLKLLGEQYEQEAIGELKKNKGVVINDDEFTDF